MSDRGASSFWGRGREPKPDCAQGRVRRPAKLLGLSARTACEATALKLRGRLTGANATDFHTRTAERYVQMLGHSKGMLMKVGQMLSFAPANFMIAPEHLSIYQDALARLCTDAPAMEPELAYELLEHELGPRARRFAEFNPEPFAAASIGQVHAAVLDDGRRVAVKLQYPEAFNAITADLANMELLTTFVRLLDSGVSLRRSRADFHGMAREVRARVTEELDYLREASSQASFARFYRGHPFIHVPGIVRELCTSRILCQELATGLSWEEALLAPEHLRNRWAEAIVRFIHGSGERFGVFHADPHPGNYLLREDGSVSCLDFGCVKRFTREQVRYKSIIGAPCLSGDVLGTWAACVQVGLLREYDPVTPEEAYAYWRNYMEMFLSETPMTVTPTLAAEWIQRCFSLRGPSANMLRHLTMQPVYTLLGRIELGTISIVAQLRPCVDWRSIGAEYMLNAAPLTEMGKLDQAFFDRRAT